MWIVYEYSFDKPKMTNKHHSTLAVLTFEFIHICQNEQKNTVWNGWNWNIKIEYIFFHNSRLNVDLRESHLRAYIVFGYRWLASMCMSTNEFHFILLNKWASIVYHLVFCVLFRETTTTATLVAAKSIHESITKVNAKHRFFVVQLNESDFFRVR